MEIKTEQIKAEIQRRADAIGRHAEQGVIIVSERQTGKTTALLEYAAENGAHRFVIVTWSSDQKDYLVQRWEKLFGKAKPPVFIAVYKAVYKKDTLRGHSRLILIDEWFNCGCPTGFFAAVTSLPGNVVVIP